MEESDFTCSCTQNFYLHIPCSKCLCQLSIAVNGGFRRGAVAINDRNFFSPLGNLPQIIEKRRRDRINSSLSELRRLVPTAFEKQVCVPPTSFALAGLRVEPSE